MFVVFVLYSSFFVVYKNRCLGEFWTLLLALVSFKSWFAYFVVTVS